MSKAGGFAAFLVVFGLVVFAAAAGSHAQDHDRDQDRWAAPFGGTWSAKFTAMSEYSFRGISLTERQPGAQATIGYTLPIVPEKLDLYLEAWGGNVRFAPAVSTEVTASASLVFHGFADKLTVWLQASRYNYPESAPELGYNYNEFGVWASWDFGPVLFDASVYWAPQYFAFAGNAWYKEAEVTVPLTFIRLGKDFRLKAFALAGNQYIERYINNGLPGDNYWNWEIGLRLRYGASTELTLSYVDTNLDVAGCSNSRNCDARVIAKLSRTF
jgi:uncharacterized protein (TIGR02001 family)